MKNRIWTTSFHDQAAKVLATAVEGVVFKRTPWDVMTLKRPIRYFDIKTSMMRPRTKNGIARCIIFLSETELLFGNIVLDQFIITVICDVRRYDIPYPDLKEKLKKIAWSNTKSKYGKCKSIYLSRKFLAPYLVHRPN